MSEIMCQFTDDLQKAQRVLSAIYDSYLATVGAAYPSMLLRLGVAIEEVEGIVKDICFDKLDL